MLFTRCIEKHVATDVITYKLMEHGNYVDPHHSYSIWKCNTVHDTRTDIIEGIKNKKAVDLIWRDVVNGLQK